MTGGLAAPLIIGATSAILGSGAVAVGVAGAAIVGSLFGVAGAGLGGYKMNKRMGDLKEFAFDPLSKGRDLHLTIAVSGWLTDECQGLVLCPVGPKYYCSTLKEFLKCASVLLK